jgi:hypothetical protein
MGFDAMHSRREARSFANDSEKFISPFPGAYCTGNEQQSVPGARLVVVLLVLAAMLTGTLLFMLVRGIP